MSPARPGRHEVGEHSPRIVLSLLPDLLVQREGGRAADYSVQVSLEQSAGGVKRNHTLSGYAGQRRDEQWRHRGPPRVDTFQEAIKANQYRVHHSRVERRFRPVAACRHSI